MKKPEHYELKKWLCKRSIIGIIVHYYQTGTDTSDTDWEIKTPSGSKRIQKDIAQKILIYEPDWIRLMKVRPDIEAEVEAYEAFAKKEAKELAEYNRLKAKFDKTDE